MKFDKNDNENDKRFEEKKTSNYLLDRKGFYVILLLCIIIVAITAMWGSEDNENPLQIEDISEGADEYQPEVRLVEDTPYEEEMLNEEIAKIMIAKSDEAVNETIEESENYVEEKNVSEVLTAVENNTVADVKSEDEQVVREEEEAVPVMKEKYVRVMAMPVIGQLGLSFADDRLVYHKTLDHWSTHKGIDIHAKEGVPVRAALEGEVLEIINDTIMGITITIAHSGELITQYSNLSTGEMVEIGEIVVKGQIISGIGRSASSKFKEGPLLHFKVIRDGKMIDPQKFLAVDP
ncbi:MAG: hypothetical protein COA82_04785 [Alkaliphilus sp.]|nr:peptidoglycan DD-metalloendopeptidase family protein [bacterium AH-315-L21]MBN4062571.1 peptidoglycan DD-metalloendopeptidase family protein [Alkaliphilus sp. AH-315-G20]MBN4074562.1 peptidoglycan DD-metalloendopeptidase family protein [bacterium AH-315-E09]PHS35375.1 MAG: hypothetical protein COA82_04785 [Alkaliphilus sp.]